MSEVYCANCVFHSTNSRSMKEKEHLCTRVIERNLVTGMPTVKKVADCYEERSRIGEDVCGPEGKWYVEHRVYLIPER